MFGLLSKKRKREELKAEPFPDEHLAYLRTNVRLFGFLSKLDQEELIGHVQVLLAEKHFEGCGGFELNDEVRIAILGQASLLIMHRESTYFPKLQTVLVYPSAYVAPIIEPIGAGQYLQGMEERVGESTHMGVVVLAWDQIKAQTRRPGRGGNVVLHEFAHQLDYEDGSTNGVPLLPDSRLAKAWSIEFSKEFERLRRADERGLSTIIDTYGAKNPAEFFAVATETFFERPRSLRTKHPILYELLKSYYLLDPASFPASIEDRRRGEDESQQV